jgi:hypothetical protein
VNLRLGNFAIVHTAARTVRDAELKTLITQAYEANYRVRPQDLAAPEPAGRSGGPLHR